MTEEEQSEKPFWKDLFTTWWFWLMCTTGLAVIGFIIWVFTL